MSFAGKRVLVTGGAEGLGKSVVEKFYEAGASVVALDTNKEALTQLKSDLPNVTIVDVDLADWKAVEIELGKLGALDILVNNAGVLDIKPALDITEEHVDFIFSVNFKAALNIARLFAKQVVTNGIHGASIVNTSSIADDMVTPGTLVYSCSKVAAKMMTKCLAVEFGPLGIRVNAIRPNVMNTPILQILMGHSAVTRAIMEKANKKSSMAPINRMLETSEAGDLILFLASDKASMITGQAVTIDGGVSLV